MDNSFKPESAKQLQRCEEGASKGSEHAYKHGNNK